MFSKGLQGRLTIIYRVLKWTWKWCREMVIDITYNNKITNTTFIRSGGTYRQSGCGFLVAILLFSLTAQCNICNICSYKI